MTANQAKPTATEIAANINTYWTELNNGGATAKALISVPAVNARRQALSAVMDMIRDGDVTPTESGLQKLSDFKDILEHVRAIVALLPKPAAKPGAAA